MLSSSPEIINPSCLIYSEALVNTNVNLSYKTIPVVQIHCSSLHAVVMNVLVQPVGLTLVTFTTHYFSKDSSGAMIELLRRWPVVFEVLTIFAGDCVETFFP